MNPLLHNLKHNKRIAWCILAGILLLIALYSPLILIGGKMARMLVDRKVAAVHAGIAHDSERVLEETRLMAESHLLNEYIISNDREHTLTTLDEERQRRNLTTAVAVNKEGMVLARTPAIGIHGDYAGQTQPWGRAAMRGESVVMIGEGRAYPLVMTAAQPIIKNGVVAGAVFGGYRIDEEYAHAFKKRYITNGAEIAFYSNQVGLLGDSFDDATTTSILSSNINIGTDWVQGEQSLLHVLIEGKGYFIKNIPIQDPALSDEQVGSILIFLPDDFIGVGGVFIAGIAAIAFIFLWYTMWPLRTKRKITFFVLILSALSIGTLIFLITWQAFEQHAIKLKQVPFTIYNSTLSFTPDSNTINLLTEQRVRIELNAGGEEINAIQAVIRYDPRRVRVDAILTADSVCENGLFLEKKIDEVRGEVRISCVILPPAFSKDRGSVADLLVVPLRSGMFTLSFDEDTQVLASDGLGTNVLRQSTSASFQVSALKTLSMLTPSNSLIPVFSATHSNSERWYKRKKIEFFWPSFIDTRYAYIFDRSPETIPGVAGTIYSTTTHAEFNADADGLFYFHLRSEDGEKETTHFAVRIDGTPPMPPIIKASETKIHPGKIVRVEFSGEDEGSGLQKNFYVNIDDSVLLPTLPTLYIPFTEVGTHSVSARVFDQAGNWSENKIFIAVEE